MYEKTINAIEPFALTMVILSGANQAGWVQFTNSGIVGYITVLVGVMLVINHIVRQVSTKQINKKGK
jgi:hypothetical protein